MPDFFVDPNIAAAHTIDSSFYTSAEVFEQCRESIFVPSWQFIGHEGLVADAGDVYPFTLLPVYLNEPLLLTRDNAGQINLLSNVCTHRGNLVVDKACKLNNLKCRYHGRKFNLDGSFLSMPEFKEVENFPSKDDDLPKPELFHWGQFLFTAMDAKYQPELFLRDMMERVKLDAIE